VRPKSVTLASCRPPSLMRCYGDSIDPAPRLSHERGTDVLRRDIQNSPRQLEGAASRLLSICFTGPGVPVETPFGRFSPRRQRGRDLYSWSALSRIVCGLQSIGSSNTIRAGGRHRQSLDHPHASTTAWTPRRFEGRANRLLDIALMGAIRHLPGG
jgi:hypothetical protein